jgi:hypothetical protein
MPFLPKILTYLQRKLKDADVAMHTTIGETLGQIVHQVLKKEEQPDDLMREYNPILKMLF